MTSIRNQRGITKVQRLQDARVAGMPVGHGFDRPYENPLLAQITTVTLAEQADVSDEVVQGQVWTFTFTDPDGIETLVLYTVTAEDDTASTDALGLAYMAGVLAAAVSRALDNIVTAVGDGPGIVITWDHADQDAWTVEAVCAPAVAETVLLATSVTNQQAGGVVLPMARFVVQGTPTAGGKRRASLPSATTETIVGVALRDINQARNPSSAFAAANEYPAGTVVGVREEGDVTMVNVGADAVAGDPVHAVISIAGGDLQGEATTERAGVPEVWTATPTALNSAAYTLTVAIADVDGLGQMTRVFKFTADASATATEISTGFQDAMALDLAFTARVVASGTTTLVLTGQEAGVSMTVADTQDQGAAVVGAWASIANTTPAIPYTKLVPRATWVLPTATSAIGTLNLR